MTLFQWITISLLSILVLRELATLARRGWQRIVLVRAMIWLGAAVAIANPELPSQAASLVGISRGADLVLYSLTLAFFATSFYLYSRAVRLQGQITKLVRHIAILEAEHSSSEGGSA